ncbi:NEL-type E3 ubiquitin ligase domain-containing protein [Pseudomonas sp. MWU13-3659]|uniref:NEL-type E3 ubiquitin ligase domain-containing protein n=1 Tax=Pseudomonas sp. MWU13-3659 TaxID=2986964 RepID=UPI0020756841|nr:NEL-type E3 ubiquitin ligase domain-containing protein [Pseudomonas sp. MWU13-3659]
MQENTPRPSAAVDPLAVAQAYQDQMIKQRLPAWVKQLSESEFTLLGDALRTQLACGRALATRLAQVRPLDAFARPLLQQVLDRHGKHDADSLYFRRWYVYDAHSVSYLAGRVPVPDSDYYDLPLLEAALYNFTAQERQQQPRHNAVVDRQGVAQVGLSALAFATVCRELDLGRQYQQHLDSILLAGTGEHSVKALLAQNLRSGMLADAVQAKAQGVLSKAELQLVIGLCRDDRLGKLDGAPVHARQLKVFGCPLQRIVVLEVIDEGWLYNSTKRVLVHVPGDPQGAWSAADDLEDYARRVLGMRLRKDDYRRFFSRFVRRRDGQRVFAALSERLDGVADWATRDLDEQTSGYRLPLFDHLADAWITRIKDDAAMIAPPVAQLDRQVQAEHDKRLRAEGWGLLTVAGLFVPVLGAALAAVMVYELLREAFQAIDDWRDDERDAALEHWLNVGKGAVTLAATAAAVTLVRRGWSEVDQLVTARLDDGSEKLWNGDLKPYRSEGPPGDAVIDEQGIHQQGERRWIEMQGHWYRVTQDSEDEPWRLLPYRGHRPQLRHNDAGAWRLGHEQPAEWTGSSMMLRRLGRPFSALDAQQLDQVLAIHDLNEDHLRALHVYGQRVDAVVADTASRLLLASRIEDLARQLRAGLAIADTALLQRARALPGAQGKEGQALADVAWAQRRALLQHLYEAQFPDTEASAILRRHFTSLHRLAVDQIWRSASEDDRAALLETRRVPLLMAQAARAQVMEIRTARVYEALTFDTPQTLDLARVSLHLLARLPEASAVPGWRLFDGDASQPLLTTEGRGTPFDLVHRNGVFSHRPASAESQAGGGELFDTLAQAYNAEQRATLNLGEPFAGILRTRLAQKAAGQRDLITGWLGLDRPNGTFLAPQRLEDGRIGYPLSGGRFWATLGGRTPRALQARLRDLYPAFSEEQVVRWLEGEHAMARLEALEQQYSTLRSHLDQWVRDAFPSLELLARRDFRKGLVDCWRWLVPELDGDQAQPRRYMLLQTRSRLRHLPSIPPSISFPHISILGLHAMRVETIPEEFLRAFPNLRSLEVTHCRLKRLPLPETLTAHLEVLDLTGNQIALEEGHALVLASCQSLVYLNLSFNPLGRSFSVFGMPRLNALHLQACQLDTFPYGVMDSPELRTLDLRDNALFELPEGFYESQLWRTGRVNLHGNLYAATPESLSIWHWLEESRVPYRLRWLDVVPASRRDDMSALWTQLETEQGATDFFTTLAALTSSGNFKSAPLARNFAVRLLDMFEYMTRDPVLKRELFDNAAVTDCQDNATIRFSDLELRVLVWRARHSELARHPERALLHLGGQLWRMNVLDQVAAEHALTAGASNESIEFALAYRIALRSKLDLPLQQDDMLYFGIPNLKPRDLRRAIRIVNAEQSPDSLAQYLARQPFWQDYLRANYARRLEVPAQMHDELQRLMELDNMEHEIRLLQISNQQREHEVLLQLTREAMGRARTISLSEP